jgi:hypothetical protein
MASSEPGAPNYPNISPLDDHGTLPEGGNCLAIEFIARSLIGAEIGRGSGRNLVAYYPHAFVLQEAHARAHRDSRVSPPDRDGRLLRSTLVAVPSLIRPRRLQVP